MNQIFSTILQNWNIMRAIRLLLGLLIIAQAFAERNILVGILGASFAGMAIMNVGCCGNGGCSPSKKINNNSNELVYEEVV